MAQKIRCCRDMAQVLFEKRIMRTAREEPAPLALLSQMLGDPFAGG